MKRQAKIFLEVDGEGLLTDTFAILADVVSFDCYESIVSSSQRVIAAYKKTTPENIDIERIFYYKRRARSSRMNPVRIYTTTDVFRAVAEHPDGEIPIGVQWSVLKLTNDNDVTVKKEPVSPTNKTSSSKDEGERGSADSIKRKLRERKEVESDIPPKIRKVGSTHYKTYMPDSVKVSMPSVVLTPVSLPSREGQQFHIDHRPPGSQINRVLHENRPAASSSPDQQKQKNDFGEEKFIYAKRTPSEPRERSSVINQYQWPDDIQCELVMTYGGITERQCLPVSLTSAVLRMIKEHFQDNPMSRLRNDVRHKSNNENTSQTLIDEMNSAIKERVEENKKQRLPIRYLQDAKMEVFKIISQLNLSKARFDSFLEWLKSLNLEEGKQGKFYLSERNRIGSGLKVQYDTDELAANKLNQIFRSRVKSVHGKKLHPVDLHSTPGTRPSSEAIQKQPIMLLMPSAGPPGTSVPSQMIATSAIQLMPQSTVPILTNTTTTISHPVTKTSTQSQKITKVSSKTQDKMRTRIQPNRKKEGPAILRRKLLVKTNSLTEAKESAEEQSSQPPTPMHLFRSGGESESTKVHSYNSEEQRPYIKTEPVSYSDAEEESTIEDPSDYSSSKEPGDRSNKYENIKHILKSDVKMPQGSEQNEKQFDLVTVKSEPMDDY